MSDSSIPPNASDPRFAVQPPAPPAPPAPAAPAVPPPPPTYGVAPQQFDAAVPPPPGGPAPQPYGTAPQTYGTAHPSGAVQPYGAAQPYGTVQPYGAAPQQYGGYPQQYAPVAYAPPRPNSGLAITSLICGIAGLVLFWLWLPVVASVVAVITGHMGLKQTKNNPALGGRGMAIGGLITGYIGVGLMVAQILIGLAVFLAFGAFTIPFLVDYS
ncbi:MAG: DUF4190 domain-containing protein [Microbacterium sp.]|uniref:DUF4190 domain-containing protein n=1 Tax=Microbacterium sp. TaxID=51671 RepID=UPI001DFF96B0|nr:DUF4190 domain-containing protein [Microbacterium sp.]MBW8763845.1 DUF4190 domain-containing protein [Microbacterium sp.]